MYCASKRIVTDVLCFLCFQDTNSISNSTNNGTPENDEYEDDGEVALTALPLFCIGKSITQHKSRRWYKATPIHTT